MNTSYFITGTDTGVGKTLVSSALVYAFAQQGLRAVGMKPVASGCELVMHESTADASAVLSLLSDDVAQLLAAGNIPLTPSQVNPYAFAPAIAPHIAASQAGVEIKLDVILAAYGMLADQADVVVVEGVGGFCVPLSATLDTADLALSLNLPVILVVGMRMGCLNHALLTAEAIRRRGLQLAGWVANSIDPDMAVFEEYLQSLQQRLAVPCLGVVPCLQPNEQGERYSQAARYLQPALHQICVMKKLSNQ